MRRLLPIVAALVMVLTACVDDDAATTTTTDTAPTTAAPATVSPTTTSGVTTTIALTTTAAPETTTATAGPKMIELTYEDDEVRGVDGRVAVETGDSVRIEVSADVTDHVHLHGYDLFADVAPGSPAVIEFTADIPGIFEVELEDRHTLLFELEVS